MGYRTVKTKTTINQREVDEARFSIRQLDDGTYQVAFEHGVGGSPLTLGIVETEYAGLLLVEEAAAAGFYCENSKVWRKDRPRIDTGWSGPTFADAVTFEVAHKIVAELNELSSLYSFEVTGELGDDWVAVMNSQSGELFAIWSWDCWVNYATPKDREHPVIERLTEGRRWDNLTGIELQKRKQVVERELNAWAECGGYDAAPGQHEQLFEFLDLCDIALNPEGRVT